MVAEKGAPRAEAGPGGRPSSTAGPGGRPRRSAKAAAPTQLVVTQVRSAIGSKPKHRGTLRALGLRRIGHHSVLPDRPEIRGMIARVPHLVSVAPAPPGDGPDGDDGEGATR
jgi:large subunit ribosomal protein L30